MSLVFQNIYPPPPSPPGDCVPPAFGAGGRLTRWVEKGVGGGSVFWKTRDTALYSTYVSALWSDQGEGMQPHCKFWNGKEEIYIAQ